MTITDNQLFTLSRIVGDGVLSGWTISIAPGGGLRIAVSPGRGFIDNVLHVTLTIKKADVFDNATQNILLQSNLLSTSTGFYIEIESPFSDTAFATFIDTVPPSVPTSFSGSAVQYDLINLFWDANTESDFDHYEIDRDTAAGFPSPVSVADDLTANGVFPDNPYQDTGLISETGYYYRIRAVDRSGNQSGYSIIGPITTPADTREPAEATNLRIYPGHTQISLSFDASPTSDVIKYIITVYVLAVDGSVATTLPEIDNGLSETAQISGLTNGKIHRVKVQAVRQPGSTEIRNTGVSAQTVPSNRPGPLAVSSLTATPGVNTVTLSWTASTSSSGSAVGQKSKYFIRVVAPGEADSSPIDVGLVTSKVLNSFDEYTDVGSGPTVFFEDDVVYLFKVTSVDSFGNESGPALVKATTTDTTPPKNPRSLFAIPGDTAVLLQWRHSQSEDVVDYQLEIDTGSGFGPPISTGYVEEHYATGLPNNVNVTFRLKAKDDVGNLSSGSSVVAKPVPDTTPPQVPIDVRAGPGDEYVRLTWAAVPDDDLSHYIVERSEITQSISTNPNFDLTPVPGTTEQFNVGIAIEFFDIGLTNGKTFVYTVRAVDVAANVSEPSSNQLASPNAGLNEEGPNRIEAPDNVTASFGSGKITVSWDYNYFGAIFTGTIWIFTTNTISAPTAFNIYRSTNSLVNFVLIDSTDTTVRNYEDENLISGQTYYYRVTAVRDNASVLVDTGSVQPPNTVFLGTVTARAGAIVSIENAQRIAKDLEGTLTEETISRLLVHRHLVRPTNERDITALSALSMIDIRNLSLIDITELPLSDEARAYYETVGKDNDGKQIVYDDNTVYILSPTLIVGNLPFVGDFQLLVNSERTSAEFTIDEDLNAVVFSEGLKDDDQVSVNGLGLTYYVPTELKPREYDVDFMGYDVKVNDEQNTEALVDNGLQTVRFLIPRAEEDVVTLTIDPEVPEFGNQEGGRLVNLGSKITLADFVKTDDRTYVSQSGGFDENDSIFVLEVGEDGSTTTRTTREHFIDYDNNAIVFTAPTPADLQIALRLRNREEVQDTLPAERIMGFDGSVFETGQFLKAQLPDLSHEGRVREQAFPLFSEMASDNKYAYSGSQGLTGSATTPYAIEQVESGIRVGYLLGTSRGLLRSVGDIFLGAGDDADIEEKNDGLNFTESSLVVELARSAVPYSGRLSGQFLMPGSGTLSPVQIFNPNLVELSDGKVLVCGGTIREEVGVPPSTNRCFIFDPVMGAWTETVGMDDARTEHASIRLANGKVLVSGGSKYFLSGDIITINRCEIYDPFLETWSPTGTMSEARSLHAMVSIDQGSVSDVIVAGGRKYIPTEEGFSDLDTCERYSQFSSTWNSTGDLTYPASGTEINSDGGVVLDSFRSREIYDDSSEVWTATDPVLIKASELPIAELDGPVKQFFRDSSDILLAVTGKSVYESRDNGISFSQMRGLDSVGVVHRVDEVGRTLFAATDLGVYEILLSQRQNSTWLQGGMIGAGTTETFDLQPLEDEMIAATEIGVFASADDGQSWTELIALEDVFNIELVGETILFVQSGQDLYRSNDAGANWAKTSTLLFLDSSAKMISRSPLDLFFGTPTGLYYSEDGTSFSLVDFDRNKDVRQNNVHMSILDGSDLLVGYDNAVFSVGPNMDVFLIAEFAGTIPTVRVNGTEIRSGFRYDTSNDTVIFETKRLSDDSVTITSNYSLYQLSGGGWYDQNPSASVMVFVDKAEQDSTSLTVDPRMGQISFKEARKKYETVTISVAQTTLEHDGELFHEEIEDKFEKEKGLALSIGRDYAANLLQLGLSIEHNFFERGLERNQYYCLTGSLVDRSMNSFWTNSEFYIMGRRDYDEFNSTLEYKTESEQQQVGAQALVPLSSLEVSSSEIWIGTDNSIFVLNPAASFVVSKRISISDEDRIAVRDLNWFMGDIMASTDKGLYSISSDGLTIEKNPGNGLPESVFVTASFNNILFAGTSNAIYFARSQSEDPFGVWFRAVLTEVNSVQELAFGEVPCYSMVVKDGIAYAALGDSIFTSTTGDVWKRIFKFDDDDDVVINRLAIFADQLFLGTNKGVYNDRGTAKSDTPEFELELLESTEDASKSIHVNDMYGGVSNFYVATDSAFLYSQTSEAWNKLPVPVPSIHEVTETSGGRKVAISNNQVFVE